MTAEQANLFGALAEPHVALRHDAPPTSVAAALRAYPRSGTQRLTVFAFIALRGGRGAIDEEMQVALRMGHNSQTPRRRELVLGGWIVDSGRRRRTPSTGSDAIVWTLTEKGRAAIAARGG